MPVPFSREGTNGVVRLMGPTFLSIELDGATLDAIVDPTRR
jgi:hypothetical protein